MLKDRRRVEIKRTKFKERTISLWQNVKSQQSGDNWRFNLESCNHHIFAYQPATKAV